MHLINTLAMRLNELISWLYSVWNDPLVPRIARVLAVLSPVYLLMPFDLNPDFLPGGLADDLWIVPILLAVAVRLVPKIVFQDARKLASHAVCSLVCVGLTGACAQALSVLPGTQQPVTQLKLRQSCNVQPEHHGVRKDTKLALSDTSKQPQDNNGMPILLTRTRMVQARAGAAPKSILPLSGLSSCSAFFRPHSSHQYAKAHANDDDSASDVRQFQATAFGSSVPRILRGTFVLEDCKKFAVHDAGILLKAGACGWCTLNMQSGTPRLKSYLDGPRKC
jgi:uncharacterized membrane protein YkvA (DUF1232 family)